MTHISNRKTISVLFLKIIYIPLNKFFSPIIKLLYYLSLAIIGLSFSHLFMIFCISISFEIYSVNFFVWTKRGSDPECNKNIVAVPNQTDGWFPLFLLRYLALHCPGETYRQLTIEKASSSYTILCSLPT